MSRSANFLFEARYSIADADLDRDSSYLRSWEIENIDPPVPDPREIELGGTSLFAGFSFRF
jgi:hypothetical protein